MLGVVLPDGGRLHPLLFSYLSIVFFFYYCIVLRVLRDPTGAEWLATSFLYHAGSRSTVRKRSIRRRREWRARGSAAAGPESKSPHQQQIRRPRQPGMVCEVMRLQRDSIREDPAARPSGRKVPRSAKDQEEDVVSAWPAGRILPPTELRSRRDRGAAPEFSHPWSLTGIYGLIEGASSIVLRGCAKNRRRTRGAWASADGSHCSASLNLERTSTSVPGDPDQRTDCKPPFQPFRAVSSG